MLYAKLNDCLEWDDGRNVARTPLASICCGFTVRHAVRQIHNKSYQCGIAYSLCSIKPDSTRAGRTVFYNARLQSCVTKQTTV